MLRRTLILVTLCAATFVSAEDASPDSRFERIERLLDEVRMELDSLKREAAGDSRTSETISRDPAPIYRDLLTERQRKLAAATRTEYRTTAAGYAFNTNSPFMMSALHWWDPSWGTRIEGTVSWRDASWHDRKRRYGVNTSLLRSIHRFEGFESFESQLYAFAGTGLFREGFGYANSIEGSFVWYEKPDLTWHLQAGAGTELNFFALGGVLFVPEIGMQAVRYLSRYQDSETWEARFPSNPRPESDLSLDAYFAFHLHFYFR